MGYLVGACALILQYEMRQGLRTLTRKWPQLLDETIFIVSYVLQNYMKFGLIEVANVKRPLCTQDILREGLVCIKVLNFCKDFREHASHPHQTFLVALLSLSRECKRNITKPKKEIVPPECQNRRKLFLLLPRNALLRDDTVNKDITEMFRSCDIMSTCKPKHRMTVLKKKTSNALKRVDMLMYISDSR